MSGFTGLKLDRRALAKLDDAAAAGLADAAEYVLEQANRTVPIEEGTLQRSGSTDIDPRAQRASVYYDTPYAVRQHEDTRLAHDSGRRAKWLERTLDEQTEKIAGLVGAELKVAMR